MNKQLLRLKRRSDDTILNIAECDDSDNLYVNVAASTPIDIGDVEITSGTLDEVKNVTSVDKVDEVTKNKSYLINDNGDWVNARGSLIGYTLTKDVQSSVQISSEEEFVFPDSAPQFTGRAATYDLPSGDISSKYFVTVYNPSNITALSMYVMNEVEIGGTDKYAAVYDKSNTAAAITVPASAQALFSATAWSSCFTSIGGGLTDESADINDAPGGADVSFAFAAQDDAIYFGAVTEFDRIRLAVATAGTYVATFVWEYWNGAAWAALTSVVDNTNATVQDGTQPFKRTGTRSISFYPPHDWTAYDIPSSPTSQFWIRARVAAYTSRAVTPELSQGWFKRVGQAEVHNFLIEGVYGGDECKITLENATALGAADGFSAWVRIKRL